MPDWSELFLFSVPPIELLVRGTAMYWFLFCLFRFVLRRDVGSLAIADVLLLVLIADAAQNAMSGGYKSISDGCLLVATIAGWNYLFDFLSFHFEPIRRWMAPPPLLLIENGRLLRANMRRELITREELYAALREQGVEHESEVRRATMEGDGVITVVLKTAPASGRR